MIYFVTFDIQKDCQIKEMVFHCDAKNAKEAKVIAKKYWEDRHYKSHQFHMYAKKSGIQNVDYLRVRTWKGTEIRKSAVMDHAYCTNISTWRIDGINQYGTKKGLYYKR
jgi:hypothetical protein